MAKENANPAMSVARYMRDFYGLSMQALAEATGMQYLTVFNLEHGKPLALGSLRKIANYFGVSLDCLARNDLAAAAIKLYSPVIRSNRRKQALREKQRLKEKIGDLGEQVVIQQERARLNGSPFAFSVNGNVSEDVTAGFDILSFDERGNPIYIEAKATVGGANTPFYMSRRELEFARRCHDNGENYQLHRLYELDNAGNCQKKILSAEELLREYEFVPVVYLVRREAV